MFVFFVVVIVVRLVAVVPFLVVLGVVQLRRGLQTQPVVLVLPDFVGICLFLIANFNIVFILVFSDGIMLVEEPQILDGVVLNGV